MFETPKGPTKTSGHADNLDVNFLSNEKNKHRYVMFIY